MAVSLYYLCLYSFKGTSNIPFPLGSPVLVLQNDFTSSGKLFLFSNEARDREREKMRKTGRKAVILCAAIKERRDSDLC